jgi:hypothetical protein
VRSTNNEALIKQRENSHLEDPGIAGRILLRMISKSGVIYHLA